MRLQRKAAPLSRVRKVCATLLNRDHEGGLPDGGKIWWAQNTVNMLCSTSSEPSGQHLKTSAGRLSGPMSFFHCVRRRSSNISLDENMSVSESGSSPILLQVRTNINRELI